MGNIKIDIQLTNQAVHVIQTHLVRIFYRLPLFQFQVNLLLSESGSLYILQLSAVAIKS